ncbi:MAG: urease accessory protein UreD [Pseudomonadota bacterium]|nr:urease accessory protein UreD [Pseudomonadota bacterium]
MFDASCPSDQGALQRATGELVVELCLREGVTALRALRQAGCLKARFPRGEGAAWPDVVTVNSSGGVVAGDRLDSRFSVQPGGRASIAAQAAERFYRARPGSSPALVRTRLEVGRGAAIEWLPQETILFDGCALDRRLDIELAPDAWFLGVEWLVFGRVAMGETVVRAALRDAIVIRRDNRLVLHDVLRADGAIAALLHRPAIAAGARAVATIVHVAPDAESRLDAVRTALDPKAGAIPEAGASAWNGLLLARILAENSASLRAVVTAILAVLRGGRPLPRVWLC